MEPARNISWFRRAEFKSGATVGRFITMASMVCPEMSAGSIQPTVLINGIIAMRTGYLTISFKLLRIDKLLNFDMF